MRRMITYRMKTIITTIGIVMAALVLSGMYFLYTYFATLQTSAQELLSSSADTVALNLNQKLASINNASFIFVSAQPVRDWINGMADFSGSSPAVNNNIANLRSDIEYSLMFNDAWLSKCIDGVYLVTGEQYIPLVFRKPTSLPLSEALNRKVYEETKEYGEMAFFYLSQEEAPAVYMVRRVNTSMQDKQLTLLFAINQASILQELTALDENSMVNVIYKDTVLISNREEAIGHAPTGLNGQGIEAFRGQSSVTVDGRRYIMAYHPLPQANFAVQVLTPYSVITNQVLPPMWTYVLVMVVLIALFSTIAGFTASAHTRFLSDLADGLEKVRREDYDVELPVYREYDLNIISGAFNSMTRDIKTLINTVYHSELSLKKTEIKLLQSQMNPHFLMNVLATISTTALLEKKENIYQMVTALSNMLEASLYNSRENGLFITVEKELGYIECYLYLQKVRFADHLNYSIHLESEELRQLNIPRLSVEPIVENAVIHGIEDSVNGGFIDVRIYRDNGDLFITVTDNGKGFDVDAVMGPSVEPPEKRHHIGIKNTNQRIQLLFGEAYGIAFESEPYVRTRATIRLPVMTEPTGGERANEKGDHR